jgi:prefoldin subunit 5
MAYKKKTLRQLNPTARKLGKAIGELQSTLNKLKNIIDNVNIMEAEVTRLTHSLSFMTQEEKLKDIAF